MLHFRNPHHHRAVKIHFVAEEDKWRKKNNPSSNTAIPHVSPRLPIIPIPLLISYIYIYISITYLRLLRVYTHN